MNQKMIALAVAVVVAVFLGGSATISTVHGMNNGAARLPPMGWMSWVKYACEIDCHRYPTECINEQLYRSMIDVLVDEGYRAAGYYTVNIDDCWEAKQRDPKTHRLMADPVRFPSGIAKLTEYAHSKHVQLGIYSDVGSLTCGGYPATRSDKGKDYTLIDAQTFSDWLVDSLKLDGCYADEKAYNETYPEFSRALAKQTHTIVYACSWPAYLTNVSDEVYGQIQQYCNYWRNYGDISDSWNSVHSIIDFYGKHGAQFAKFHGPGGWFDPDMLIIGNDGLSYEQSKTQMAFWCLWSAPLLMSNDLRTIKPEFKAILQNRHLIAVDQDPLGVMGTMVKHSKNNQQSAWTKKMSPPNEKTKNNAYAVIYFNNNSIGVPSFMSYKLSDLIPQLNPAIRYAVHDLFENDAIIEHLHANQSLTLKVKTSGSVRMVRLVPEA